jgi:hypothetical protein
MYRNTAALPSSNMTSTSPTTLRSDSDLNLAELLVRKRQQIDQEIADFKAGKEKEFQEFERSLRKQRQRRKRSTASTSTTQKDSRPGALSLLALPNKHGVQANGHIRRHSQGDNDGSPRPNAPLSKPTTGLETTSIRGHTLPASTFLVGSPPSPRSPSRSFRITSQRPPTPGVKKGTMDFLALPEKGPMTPPTPDAHDAFAGVFTPAFLPLLDSKPATATSSSVATPTLIAHESSSLPGSASISVSPLQRAVRSKTAPVLPSTSLPSALRTASGTAVRKRKHVTFQLADSAIVEPSSSYEEMPSPSPKDEGHIDDGIDDMLKRNGLVEEDVPRPTHGLARALPSPTLKGREKRAEQLPGDLTNAIEADGNVTGVGFFELDEELDSPRLNTTNSFVDDLDEETSPVESRKRSDEDSISEKLSMAYEYSGSVPIDIVRPSSSWIGSFGH